MMAGDAEMAIIIACRPPSIRLAISISPSRVSRSNEPISRMYSRTGSVVRPNSESTVDNAASAASSASSSVARAAGGPDQQGGGIGGLLVDGDAHVVEHPDDRLERLGVDQSFRDVVVDLLLGQEPSALAHLDERSELASALGEFRGRELANVEAELADQRPLLGLRHLDAQRLGVGPVCGHGGRCAGLMGQWAAACTALQALGCEWASSPSCESWVVDRSEWPVKIEDASGESRARWVRCRARKCARSGGMWGRSGIQKAAASGDAPRALLSAFLRPDGFPSPDGPSARQFVPPARFLTGTAGPAVLGQALRAHLQSRWL